jgi:hypothetical protein
VIAVVAMTTFRPDLPSRQASQAPTAWDWRARSQDATLAPINHLRRLEGQEDLGWGRVAEAIGIRPRQNTVRDAYATARFVITVVREHSVLKKADDSRIRVKEDDVTSNGRSNVGPAAAGGLVGPL